MHFLAEIGPHAVSGGGMNWWQSLGGLVLVFGLLVVSLKLLGRFNKRQSGGTTSLLTVWHLGPKREIQVLRLGDEVHFIYRHEGAMVLLKKQSFAQWELEKEANQELPSESKMNSLLSGKISLPRLSFLQKSANPAPGIPVDLS